MNRKVGILLLTAMAVAIAQNSAQARGSERRGLLHAGQSNQYQSNQQANPYQANLQPNQQASRPSNPFRNSAPRPAGNSQDFVLASDDSQQIDDYSDPGYGRQLEPQAESYGNYPSCDCTSGGCCDVCCDPCCDSCCDTCCDPRCCPPWWAHRTGVWGEALYLQAEDADVTHAQQQNGTGLPGGAGVVPFGIIGQAELDYEPAYRAGIDIACSTCSSIFVTWTQYESSTSGNLGIPTIPGGGGAVGSFVQHPNAVINFSNGPVAHTYDIDFQNADFGVRRVWRAGANHVVNWSLGARYNHMDQDFAQFADAGVGAGIPITTSTNIEFDGGGIRLGLDGEQRCGSSCWSVYGKAFVTPMTGRYNAEYTMTNTATDTRLARAEWGDDRIVTNLEYEAGLAWTSYQGCWRVTGGYMVSEWDNVITTDSFINAVTADNYENVEGDLSFSGLVTRVEYRW